MRAELKKPTKQAVQMVCCEFSNHPEPASWWSMSWSIGIVITHLLRAG
jgi:hypothetical protein